MTLSPNPLKNNSNARCISSGGAPPQRIAREGFPLEFSTGLRPPAVNKAGCDRHSCSIKMRKTRG
jgi:hypothetical protein